MHIKLFLYSVINILCHFLAGTSLGDPIEVGALAAALVDCRPAGATLALMAAKSWSGHAEPGAGMHECKHKVGMSFFSNASAIT